MKKDLTIDSSNGFIVEFIIIESPLCNCFETYCDSYATILRFLSSLTLKHKIYSFSFRPAYLDNPYDLKIIEKCK